jgi:hypothetical protein
MEAWSHLEVLVDGRVAVRVGSEAEAAAVLHDGVGLHANIERAIRAVVDAQLVAGNEDGAAATPFQIDRRGAGTQPYLALGDVLQPHCAKRGTLSARDKRETEREVNMKRELERGRRRGGERGRGSEREGEGGREMLRANRAALAVSDEKVHCRLRRFLL